jgi:hypothetical protein
VLLLLLRSSMTSCKMLEIQAAARSTHITAQCCCCRRCCRTGLLLLQYVLRCRPHVPGQLGILFTAAALELH